MEGWLDKFWKDGLLENVNSGYYKAFTNSKNKK